MIYDIIALSVYILSLMSMGRPTHYINSWAIKELNKQKARREEINKNHFLEDIQRNESEYASVNSRIYQATIFIFSTYFMFALLLSFIIYQLIFIGATFRVLPFFVFLVSMLVYKTYKNNAFT